MTTQPEIVDSIGDVDPFSFGGGFIFSDHTFVWWEDSGKETVLVYSYSIPEDVLEDLSWVELKDLSSFTGVSARTYRKHSTGSLKDRADLILAIASYYGDFTVGADAVARSRSFLLNEYGASYSTFLRKRNS